MIQTTWINPFFFVIINKRVGNETYKTTNSNNKKTADLIFKDYSIYLFGSRTKDNLKGGDIDLYIQLPYKPHFLDKPKFKAYLKRKSGEQKIDVIIDYPQKTKTLLDTIVSKEGIKL